jgi:hypothetical protein
VTRRPKASLPAASRLRGVPVDPHGLLDTEAPPDSYAVDRLVARIPVAPELTGLGIVDNRWSPANVRAAVSRIGTHARDGGAFLDKEPETVSEARQHQKELDDVAARCAILAQRDVEDFAHHFVPEQDNQTTYSIDDDPAAPWHKTASKLDDLGRMARELAEAIAAFRSTNPLGRARNTGNSSPLEHEFIRFAAIQWQVMTGAEPPRSRGGLYVEFLAAAWQDLAFPPIGDAFEVLGRINERRSA